MKCKSYSFNVLIHLEAALLSSDLNVDRQTKERQENTCK